MATTAAQAVHLQAHHTTTAGTLCSFAKLAAHSVFDHHQETPVGVHDSAGVSIYGFVCIIRQWRGVDCWLAMARHCCRAGVES